MFDNIDCGLIDHAVLCMVRDDARLRPASGTSTTSLSHFFQLAEVVSSFLLSLSATM